MRSTESTAEMIVVNVNGQRRDVPAKLSVATLLEWLNLPVDRVAVELNKSIVRKREWSRTPISGGSQLEIVEFVGGG